MLEMHLNNVAAGNIAGEAAYLPAANADEAAPRERQEAPRQPDILLVEHPEQQHADPPSRIVQVICRRHSFIITVLILSCKHAKGEWIRVEVY